MTFFSFLAYLLSRREDMILLLFFGSSLDFLPDVDLLAAVAVFFFANFLEAALCDRKERLVVVSSVTLP